ncbi:hypothetical protein B0H14DRAFT_755894 [Mycena olivaceomarginata]|nr:hypothetical protein B0H14DRAFT_755894 [Mycena olivaceomarginata]
MYLSRHLSVVLTLFVASFSLGSRLDWISPMGHLFNSRYRRQIAIDLSTGKHGLKSLDSWSNPITLDHSPRSTYKTDSLCSPSGHEYLQESYVLSWNLINRHFRRPKQSRWTL